MNQLPYTPEACSCKDEASNDVENRAKRTRLLVSIFLGVGLVFFLCWGLVLTYHLNNPTSTAQFGDGFGVVNAFFSSMALAGVIAALIIQAGEYKLAETDRKEGLKAQEIIGRQQYAASLTAAINSLTELNRDRRVERKLADQDANYMRMVVDQGRMRSILLALVQSLETYNPSSNAPVELRLDTEQRRLRNTLAEISDQLIDFAEICEKHAVYIADEVKPDIDELIHAASSEVKSAASTILAPDFVDKHLREQVPYFRATLSYLSSCPIDQTLGDRYPDRIIAAKRLIEVRSDAMEAVATLSGVFFDEASREES
ncbi:hypothetical protein [Stieleria varia]|uniref:Uncharacterized protein n=1 Tax=Stieleria varia TaxID=2528005 RepID=A0A5C6AEY6_9BACT|nr:hypothetical protein [Stieleria varia]TWT98582.1 hypothetical protein Pla52n_50980 [Stieleria varia]